VNPFARRAARLGFAPSRTGNLRLKSDFSRRHRSAYGVTPPYPRLIAWIEGADKPSPTDRAPFCQFCYCKYMIFQVFNKFLPDFGLARRHTARHREEKPICEKPDTAARASKACLISAVHFY
jgi:hypothetical protein